MDKLIIVKTKLDTVLLWGVRPITWAGIWKDDLLISGNCIAYFPIKAQAEEYINLKGEY